ncbi:hypothetical protein MUN81_09395 [Hymenobacter sp. 5317J-9]|uniref:hypothetical protein n=1 Tax=Hymenobacter sp. 5317J-9 TaxID=2932250 RepID=UPI001FD6454B|nr:hypothetical protein [Hymenobacter sp. 5317J-9]UOQ99692.1 hypothetical protein MUN81_09395 [Hymenobacter sp. 5317J-9]
MTDLENLKQTSLHDMGVDALNIDFKHSTLTLQLGVYNEDTRSYDSLKLEFQGISDLNLGALDLSAGALTDLDVDSHTIIPQEAGHAIRFGLLTGHGQPGAEWSFTFEQVKIS